MKNFLLLLLCLTPFLAPAQVSFSPPPTEKKPVVDTLHGFLLTDNYRWLEDKSDPKVVEWTKAQHDFTLEPTER